MLFKRKPRELRKLKKKIAVKVPIGCSDGTNIIVTVPDVPTYKFHRFQRKLIILGDLDEKLKEMGIDTDDEEILSPDELKRILLDHSAFRDAKNKNFTIGGYKFKG